MNAPILHDTRISMADQVFFLAMICLALPPQSERCDADMLVMEAVDMLPRLNTANHYIAEMCSYLAEFRAADTARARDAVRWKLNQSVTRFARVRLAEGLERMRGAA